MSKILSQSYTIEEMAKANRLCSASEGYKDNAYIHTQDGRFYASNPTWSLNAIAHALGQTARYRGNCDEFYSVAEHSVLVSLLMEHVVGGDPYEGILHDATESILPDVSAPFKQLFPDLRAVDKRFEASLRAHFGLGADKSQECAKADWIALFIESAQILPNRGQDFEDPYNFRPQALKLREQQGWKIQCLNWKTAKRVFLERFEQVSNR
jgi:hypothetical protein